MLFVIDDIPSFRIHFYKTSIADKWQSLVEEAYIGDGKDIDNKRSFYHLQNKTDVRNDLLKAIEQINSFLKFNFSNSKILYSLILFELESRFKISTDWNATFSKPQRDFADPVKIWDFAFWPKTMLVGLIYVLLMKENLG